jgi:endonuclease/exonuclease/phosphatase family metal-dependent hydrolase
LDGYTFRVMSFNIRGSFRDRAKTDAWDNRADLNVGTIERWAPDLIGFQELQKGNLETYLKCLTGYSHVLGPRYGNRAPHNFNAIFFDAERLALLDRGGFWLSETPERYSASWETRAVRSASWATFRLTEGAPTIVHLNTHLDHVSRPARVEGSRLILRKLAELPYDGVPVILTGDFNCRPGTPVYRNFIEEGFVDTHLDAGNEDTLEANTFHAFKGTRYRDARPGLGPRRIDWILHRDPARRIRTVSHSIVRDCDEERGAYPSDHYPVIASLELPPEEPKEKE